MPRVTLQEIKLVKQKWRVFGGMKYQTEVYHQGRYIGTVFRLRANKCCKGWTVRAQALGGGRVGYADFRWLLDQLNEVPAVQAQAQ